MFRLVFVLLSLCNHFKSLQLPQISLLSPSQVSAPLSSPSPLFWGSLSSPLLSSRSRLCLSSYACCGWSCLLVLVILTLSFTHTLFYIPLNGILPLLSCLWDEGFRSLLFRCPKVLLACEGLLPLFSVWFYLTGWPRVYHTGCLKVYQVSEGLSQG